MNTLLLDLLAFGAVLSGILVITSKNPVISVLFLISVFINAAGYLLLLGVGFVGISYLIVYVGAIAILFLFVVIILNIQWTEIGVVGREYTKNLPLGFIVGLLFFFELLSILPSSYLSVSNIFLNFINPINGVLLDVHTSFVGVHTIFMNDFPDINFLPFLQIESIGQGLYTQGSIWLVLGSVILLLAIVGPITLCIRSLSQSKNQ